MDQIRRAITEEARCVDRPMRPSDRDAALVARRGLRVVEAQPPGGQLACPATLRMTASASAGAASPVQATYWSGRTSTSRAS